MRSVGAVGQTSGSTKHRDSPLSESSDFSAGNCFQPRGNIRYSKKLQMGRELRCSSPEDMNMHKAHRGLTILCAAVLLQGCGSKSSASLTPEHEILIDIIYDTRH